MNGNVHDELGLITEFQTAVLKALKPVILEMDPTTMHGWIGSAQALRLCLQEALCPPERKDGTSMISVPAELQGLLNLPLNEVFSYVRCCTILHVRKELLSRVRNVLIEEFRSGGGLRFYDARLSDLIALSSRDPYYFWKIPALGKAGRGLIFQVLTSLGLRLG